MQKTITAALMPSTISNGLRVASEGSTEVVATGPVATGAAWADGVAPRVGFAAAVDAFGAAALVAVVVCVEVTGAAAVGVVSGARAAALTVTDAFMSGWTLQM